MLTIGEPIKPNTARRFTASTPPDGAGTDPFCERIVGSYALMSMNFTPKDMLLLMFASPEIAEFGDQITNIGEISNITNSRGFLLNIVNNVINRILLAEHETLLYKDEIYIANVLRRLGVADVNDFLKEVSAVTEESRTVFRLAEHYERNARFLRETRMTVRGDETSKDAVGGTEEPDAPELPPASGEPLFGEIFRRTGLERIVSVLRSYGTYERGERVSSALELNASEWFGVWNAVKLFESRRNVSVSAFSPVHRHYNVYETGAALPPDAEDSQIVGSAAVAALINVAHNALLARLARATQADVRVRVDVAQIFPTATASTLERFRSWHTERIGTVRAERVFERRLSELDRLEERLFARMREERLSVDSSSLTFLVDTRAEITPDESGEDESSALWRESHYRSMLSRIRQERDHIERLTQLVGSSESADAIEQFLERVRVSDPASRRIEEIARMNLLPLEDRAPAESSAAAAARLRRADGDARDFLLEVIERGMSGLSGAEDAGSAETRQEAELYVARPEETEEERDIALEARLKADLDAYDRRNKEIAQQFAERAERARHRSAAGDAQRPDAGKRTAIEALAGLDDSGKLLKELLEADSAEARARTIPELTLLLDALPPERRDVYERLLLEMREASRGEGGASRPVGLPEFNADAAAAAREWVATEVRHIERQTRGDGEILRERVARTMERTEQARRGTRADASVRAYETPRLFHRRETQFGPQGYEENARPRSDGAVRTDSEVTIRENILREDRIETEINRVVRETEAKSLRDIDAAISQALAGQMRMIESRIYNGVERKLDMERARRGK